MTCSKDIKTKNPGNNAGEKFFYGKKCGFSDLDIEFFVLL
jgi:hypothetical protein